jgi:hypothetical protein
MEETRFAANRAVALGGIDLGRCPDLEPNPPAMAAAGVIDQGFAL